MKKLIPFLTIPFLLASCQTDDEGQQVEYQSTYEIIQGEIWDQSCTSCHMAGSPFAKQSDLILTSDVSYEQLVGRAPSNEAAIADGLELVGTDGLESIYKSYLWEKINANDIEHFYSDHPEYGAIMPLGDDFLTNGQLEFIREWILAGAPKDGFVADETLLEDTSRHEVLPFEPLPLPAQGYQFKIEPFDIQAGKDREIFIYEELGNPEPVYINQVEISMKSGSHHFLIYAFPDEFPQDQLPTPGKLRDVYNVHGEYQITTLYHMQFHEFVTGTQWPFMNYKFPEGVALKVPAYMGFDLNSHYANKSDKALEGEVYANLHTIDEDEVVHVAEMLSMNHDDFVLPAKKITTLKRTFKTNKEMNVFQLFSHAHSHMTEFKVYKVGGADDGDLIYVSYDWEHPPILEIDPPLNVKAGEGFRLEVTYDNDEPRDLTFGLQSTDEMMILFGAYY